MTRPGYKYRPNTTILVVPARQVPLVLYKYQSCHYTSIPPVLKCSIMQLHQQNHSLALKYMALLIYHIAAQLIFMYVFPLCGICRKRNLYLLLNMFWHLILLAQLCYYSPTMVITSKLSFNIHGSLIQARVTTICHRSMQK